MGQSIMGQSIMKDILIVDEERPARFWTLMGPRFSSEAVRRELPYLADRPGRVWVVAPDAGSEEAPAPGFACADAGADDAVLREVWAEKGADAVGADVARIALRYLFSTGALRVRATVKGRAVGMLTAAGFAVAGTKGGYTCLEARP